MTTVVVPDEGTGERARRRRQERRRRRIQTTAFATALTLLTASIPALGYAGYLTLLNSRSSRTIETVGGRVGDVVFNPDAEIPRTPAGLVVHVGDLDQLVSLTVVSVSPNGEGGSVVFVPITTLAPAAGDRTLAAVHAEGGKAALEQAVEDLLDIRFDDVTELDDDGWLFVTAPSGPFEIDGEDVESDEVGDFLEEKAPGESDLARLVRHQSFWDVWLFAVGGNIGSLSPSRPDLRRDELDLPRFVLGLSRGPYVQQTLPVMTAEPAADGSEQFRVDDVAARVLVARLMPGAVRSAGSAGTRVRLLDAVDDENDETLLEAARRLVPAGARLVLVGDADKRQPQSEIMYYRPADEPAAAALREALGTGSVAVLPLDVVAFDVTVIVGIDASYDGTTTTSPPDGTGSTPTG